jgi:hypothetical protein
MKFINPESKTYRLFRALRDGKKITASHARKMGIGNVRAEVTRVRQHGFVVYANTRKARNGVTVTEYVMGKKASRRLVAAGYKAIQMGLVD